MVDCLGGPTIQTPESEKSLIIEDQNERDLDEFFDSMYTFDRINELKVSKSSSNQKMDEERYYNMYDSLDDDRDYGEIYANSYIFDRQKSIMDGVNEKIKKCEENRISNFELKNIVYPNVLDMIGSFTWITNLELQCCSISKIDVLPPNLTNCEIMDNNIKTFDCSVIPDSLTYFRFCGNRCENFLMNNECLDALDISINYLTGVLQIPDSITVLDASENKIDGLKFGLKSKICKLSISSTSIRNIDNLPDSIMYLLSSKCFIDTIESLPKSLIHWECEYSSVQNIKCDFPNNIECVDLASNLLSDIPKLPDSIRELNLEDNDFMIVPTFNETIRIINLKRNFKIPNQKLYQLRAQYPYVRIEFDEYFNRFPGQYGNIYNPNFNYTNRFKVLEDEDLKFDPSNPHYIVHDKTYEI